ncbi:hypothetical protein APV28_2456 [Comamonas testosteroni]|nr:hypothetical protein APV28_2456 [Comamonas testosteroni]
MNLSLMAVKRCQLLFLCSAGVMHRVPAPARGGAGGWQ